MGKAREVVARKRNSPLNVILRAVAVPRGSLPEQRGPKDLSCSTCGTLTCTAPSAHRTPAPNRTPAPAAHCTPHLRRTAGAVQVGAVQVGAGDGLRGTAGAPQAVSPRRAGASRPERGASVGLHEFASCQTFGVRPQDDVRVRWESSSETGDSPRPGGEGRGAGRRRKVPRLRPLDAAMPEAGGVKRRGRIPEIGVRLAYGRKSQGFTLP